MPIRNPKLKIETYEECEERDLALADELPHPARKLRDALRNCTEETPCKSGACRRCSLAVRLPLVKAAKIFIESHPEMEAQALTVIDARWSRKIGELEGLDFILAKKALGARLRRAYLPKGTIILGFLDISYETDNDPQSTAEDRWQPHLHAIVFSPDIKGVKKSLKPIFKRSPGIYFPVMFQPIKPGTLTNILNYVFKSSVFDNRRYRQNGKRRSNNRKPPSKPLSIELARFLHQSAFTDRVFGYGVKRNGRNFESIG